MEDTQTRLNFPDYSAEEQKHDLMIAQTKQNKVVYLMKIEDRWAWYHHHPRGAFFRFTEPGVKILEAYTLLSEDFPDHIVNPIRMVVNPGLEAWLKDRLEEVKQIEKDGCLIHRAGVISDVISKGLGKGGR